MTNVGGARIRAGRPPNPDRAPKTGPDAFLTLPAGDSGLEAPPWPLTRPLKREVVLWERIWQRPQAREWARLGMADEVAFYVRRFVEAEDRGASTRAATVVRQLGDALGLSIPGMRANRWRIMSEVDELDATKRPSSAAEPSRQRLRVVAPPANGT